MTGMLISSPTSRPVRCMHSSAAACCSRLSPPALILSDQWTRLYISDASKLSFSLVMCGTGWRSAQFAFLINEPVVAHSCPKAERLETSIFLGLLFHSLESFGIDFPAF